MSTSLCSALNLDARKSEDCMATNYLPCKLKELGLFSFCFFIRGGFHRDPRQIVQYKDLDAPDDVDAF